MTASDLKGVVRGRSSIWLQRGAIGLIAIAVVAAIGAVAARSVHTADPRQYLTHTVARGSLSVTVTENGAVESSQNKEIKCLVKGGSKVLWVIETGTIVQPGDELVRLDQSTIEDNILRQQIVYETALANKITAESDVAVAETAITEYLEGTYRQERSTIEKEIFAAEQDLRKAELSHQSARRLTARGLIQDLQLEGERFAVDMATKELELKQTKLEALEKYTKEKSLQELRSTLRAYQAKLASYVASLELEKTRLDREKEQLANCVIKADTAGMVIFPSMAEWKQVPDIEEGATVHEQQTLLMIPDVTQMQVKVGIHESKVELLRVGMPAKVQLQDVSLEGKVDSIAEVTRPAGWWTGNMVKYDTIIKLEPRSGLKPGMSAVVDIAVARYDDVVTIPVAAIVETAQGVLCWVKTDLGVQRRLIEPGGTNEEFTVVKAGLHEGDEVILNPIASVEEAKLLAIQPRPGTAADETEEAGSPARDSATQPADQSASKGKTEPQADQS
jgi:multidrug resistance efflux pump